MNVTFETKYKNKAGKHEWLTPPELIKLLGPFDLDPCFSEPRPWDTAKNYFTETQNGLDKDWFGFVWCNPPYGKNTSHWLKKCSEYKNCIALVFARTETRMFKEYVWEKASSLFFIYKRLKFHNIDGTISQSAGAPSVLISWNKQGDEALSKLVNSKFNGKQIFL